MSFKAKMAMKTKFFDHSVENLSENFFIKLEKELSEASEVQRRTLTAESLVDRYGKNTPGYIDFEEFKEVYKNHVHFADDENIMKQMPEDNILRALFNRLDPDQRHRISRQDFGKIVSTKGPISTFLNRFRKKLLRGQERLRRVTQEEF